MERDKANELEGNTKVKSALLRWLHNFPKKNINLFSTNFVLILKEYIQIILVYLMHKFILNVKYKIYIKSTNYTYRNMKKIILNNSVTYF